MSMEVPWSGHLGEDKMLAETQGEVLLAWALQQCAEVVSDLLVVHYLEVCQP